MSCFGEKKLFNNRDNIVLWFFIGGYIFCTDNYILCSVSTVVPGTRFACDTSGSGRCGSYYERSSVCVETTAYTLLAMLHSGDTDKTMCLARWLVMIRNGAGGYYSSQVRLLLCYWSLSPFYCFLTFFLTFFPSLFSPP